MEALFIIFAIHNKHIVIIDELRFSCKRSLFCGFFLFFFLLVIATFCHFECCLCCYTFCFNSGSSQTTVHCSIRAPYSLLYCSIYSFHYITCIVVAIIFNTYTRRLWFLLCLSKTCRATLRSYEPSKNAHAHHIDVIISKLILTSISHLVQLLMVQCSRAHISTSFQ